jgi:hypothetical protein
MLYALYRLVAHMEEPSRFRVGSLISKALQFRNATVPKKNLPFSLPFLAHSDFKQQVQLWLRQVVIPSKELTIPFFYLLIEFVKLLILLFENFCTTTAKWNVGG